MERVPLSFPIRFATRNVAVQTTTRELSKSGVFIRCLEQPAVGTAIAMTLYLPGSANELAVQGVVRELARPEEEAGFWAEFSGLESRHKAQIAEVLARSQPPSQPAAETAVESKHPGPRRAHPRHTARFAVRFASVQDFVLEYAANISAGGVFVQTQSPLPLKTIVRVEMELPGASGPVPARGLVVHRVTPEEAAARGGVPGMGVQFLDVDDQFRERIDTAIDHILKA